MARVEAVQPSLPLTKTRVSLARLYEDKFTVEFKSGVTVDVHE